MQRCIHINRCMHMQHPVHALPARTWRVCDEEGKGVGGEGGRSGREKYRRINFARAGMRDRAIINRRHSITEIASQSIKPEVMLRERIFCRILIYLAVFCRKYSNRLVIYHGRIFITPIFLFISYRRNRSVNVFSRYSRNKKWEFSLTH